MSMTKMNELGPATLLWLGDEERGNFLILKREGWKAWGESGMSSEQLEAKCVAEFTDRAKTLREGIAAFEGKLAEAEAVLPDVVT